MSDSLRVALIGYGLAGRVFHGPLVRATPGLHIAAVVARDPERRAAAARDFPDALLLEAVEHVWDRRHLFDLVVVATPPGSHAQLGGEAVEAGLASVVDKPLATSAGEARLLVERARRAGLLLVPFHNRRWDSDQLTLRRLLGEEDALGRVLRYESRFERWRPRPNPASWREGLPATEGGGVLLDLGIHLVDQALSLFGPVSGVDGEVRARRGGADDDVFLALHHESGVDSHLWASAVCAAPGPRLRVLGSKAALVMPLLDGQEAALREGRQPNDLGFGVEPRGRWGRLVRGDRGKKVPSVPGRWLSFYEGIERSLRTGAPPPVAPDDAVAALEVLDRARG